MRSLRLCFALSILASSLACEKKPDSTTEMPAATSWRAPAPVASQPGAGGNPHGGMGGDPHAGMGMGGDPHAGMGMGGDPHAGMGMNPAMAGMQPPDPNRPIDKSKVLRGTIEATPEVRDRIKPGAILFLAVRPIDKQTGEVLGAPIAVERIDLASLPSPFTLDGSHAMVADTEFAGDVVIDARVDGDGDAISKEPGDVTGKVKATIPAEGLILRLDTVLR